LLVRHPRIPQPAGGEADTLLRSTLLACSFLSSFAIAAATAQEPAGTARPVLAHHGRADASRPLLLAGSVVEPSGAPAVGALVVSGPAIGIARWDDAPSRGGTARAGRRAGG